MTHKPSELWGTFHNCKFCNKQFAHNGTRKMFCDHICANAWHNRRRKPCTVEGCDQPIVSRGICGKHYYRLDTYGDVNPKMLVVRDRKVGQEFVNKHGYVLVKTETGTVAKHRIVMAKHLKRELLPGENIHHINGDRQDNRVKNLELWTVAQPAGQRVDDKIEWAKEFLESYGYKVTERLLINT